MSKIYVLRVEVLDEGVCESSEMFAYANKADAQAAMKQDFDEVLEDMRIKEDEIEHDFGEWGAYVSREGDFDGNSVSWEISELEIIENL